MPAGRISSWVREKITLFIYYATPGTVIEIRLRIMIELIAFSIPHNNERVDPTKILKIKFEPMIP